MHPIIYSNLPEIEKLGRQVPLTSMYFLSALQVLAYGNLGRSEISAQKHSRQTKGNHGYKRT